MRETSSTNVPPENNNKILSSNDVNKIAIESKNSAMEQMDHASSLGEYLLWHKAASTMSPKYIDGMTAGGVNSDLITASYLLSDYTDPRRKLGFEYEAENIMDLYNKLHSLVSEEGNVKVIIRNPRGTDTYYVLSEFPQGTIVTDPLSAYNEQSIPSYVYFKPYTGGLKSVCSSLLSNNSEVTFSIPLQSSRIIRNAMELEPDNVKQYDAASPEAKRNYILAGIIGSWSNENNIVKIPNSFLNKQSDTQDMEAFSS